MNKKLVLTSTISLVLACPAVATPSHTSNTFPVDGYMQPDYTYVGQATYENIGAYGGDVVAEPEYNLIEYTVNAGQYLPQSSTTVTTCTAGSFCPGLPSAVNYSTTTNQGITSCATVGDNTYTQSATGASAETDCYKACATSMVAHAETVTGNDYYGAGVDTCVPTACENGWHVKPGAPDLTTIIGVTQAGTGYTSNDYTGSDYDTDGMSNTIISNDPMAFAVDYGNSKGVIKGHGRCSKTGVTTPWYNTQGYQFASDHFVNNLTDETDPATGGQYCYCQLDSYTPVNGSAQSLSAPWVFNYGIGGAGSCADDCASRCANYLQIDAAYYLAFRAAVFGSLGASLASCEANTITINWTDAADGAVAANNAGTATYDGDIRTPSAAVDKTNIGLRFKGWRFSKPQN